MMGAPMQNVIDITSLLRERAEKRDGARKLRFVTLADGTPEDVLRAIAAAVKERRADAYRRLPSPWRERLLKSWATARPARLNPEGAQPPVKLSHQHIAENAT